jgi:tetratricopeptide (TPR) repeat protein
MAAAREPAAIAAATSAGAASLTLVLSGMTEIVPLTSVGMVMLFSAVSLLIATGRLAPPSGGWPRLPRLSVGGAALPGRVGPLALGGLAALAVLSTPALDARAGLLEGAGRPLFGALAALYLNLGSLEVASATVREPPLHALEQTQRVQAARSWLRQADQLDPENPRIVRALAAAELAASEPAQGRSFLAQAEARTAPGDDRGWFQLGRLYRAAGDVDRAVAAWVRLEPRLGEWTGTGPHPQLCAWGEELVRQGRWQEAITVNRAAIQVTPGFPTPYPALSLALRQQGGDTGAEAEMQALAQRYPRVPWPHLELARLYRRTGLLEQADAAERHGEALRRAAGVRARYQPAAWGYSD